MFISRKIIVAAIAILALPSVFAAKDYKHSDLIESFSVLPAVTQVSVSPNGKRMIIRRSTSKNGDYILEVRQTKDLKKKPVLFGAKHMEISNAYWLSNDLMAVNFTQNIQDGTKNYWVSKFAIVDANGKSKWRIPFPKDNQARFSLRDLLIDDPKHVLMSYDIDDDRRPDLIKYNIYTGRTKTVIRSTSKLSGFISDTKGNMRAASSYDLKNNSIDQYVRLTPDDEWELIYKNRADNRERFDFLDFSIENPQEIYISANRGQDTTGIYTYNIKTKEYSDRLFGLKSVNVDGVVLSNKKKDYGRLLGFSYTGKQPKVHWVDEYEQQLRDAVKNVFPNKLVSLVSRSEDDNEIVVRTQASNDPGTFYLLSNLKSIQPIGERFPLINRELLGDVKYVKYPARDGQRIPAYITLPKVGKKPYPTVVMPHGGPWVRDVVIYDEWAQLLASHGYMVLQPQYRGSTGFGLKHWKLGDNNWGQTMQDDKDDGVKYLVDKGLADPDKVAIFGWSYGGYAAFAASVRENGPFACSIAGAGVADLSRINASLFNGSRYGRVFQGKTVSGLSPIEHADKLAMPLFIIHGDIDQRVPVEQSRLMVKKLKSLGKPHKYLELEGADHFYNTLYYNHKAKFYPAMIDWLENSCFTNKSN